MDIIPDINTRVTLTNVTRAHWKGNPGGNPGYILSTSGIIKKHLTTSLGNIGLLRDLFRPRIEILLKVVLGNL